MLYDDARGSKVMRIDSGLDCDCSDWGRSWCLIDRAASSKATSRHEDNIVIGSIDGCSEH